MRYLLLIFIFTGCYDTQETVHLEQKQEYIQVSFFHNKKSTQFQSKLTTFPKGNWYQNCYYQEKIIPEKSEQLVDIGSFNLTFDNQTIGVNYLDHYELFLESFIPPDSKILIKKTPSETLSGDLITLDFPLAPEITELPDPIEIDGDESLIFQVDQSYPQLLIELFSQKQEDEEIITGRLSCYFNDTKYLFIIPEQLNLLPRGSGTITIGGTSKGIINHQESVHHYHIISGYRSSISWSE